METVKIEDETESPVACRICLTWDSKLYNIFESNVERAFTEVMGLSLSTWDGLPQYICVICRALLRKAHALRIRCHRANTLLKKALSQHAITNTYIHKIDHATHKLTYILTKKISTVSIQQYNEDEQDNIQTDTQENLCNDIKDEVETEDRIVNETEDVERDILQMNVIENDNKDFNMNCDDDIDYRDEEIKIVDEFKNTIATREATPALAEVVNETEDLERVILQINVIENDNKDFDMNCDGDIDYRDEEIKIVDDFKNKIDTKEATPALAEVEIVERNLDKQIYKVITKKGGKTTNKKSTQESGAKNRKKTIDQKEDESRKLFTIEEIEEFVKKYNFEIQSLTDEEMAEDMERRKVSDRYIKCKFKCTLCYKGFLTTSSFDNHMKKDHNARNSKNECGLCLVSFRKGFSLRQHVQNAHRLRMRCGECGAAVWGRKECVAHAARHAGTTKQCKHCGKHFLKNSSYTWHMRAAHPVENAAHGSCELCGEIYTSAKGLRAHKLLAHSKSAAPELQCKRCRTQFDNKDALKKHKELQVGDKCDFNLSPCSACGEVCADAEALLRHLHVAHKRDIFTCDSCNKSFLSKSSLLTHIDRAHRGIRPPQLNQALYRRNSKRHAQRRKQNHNHMCELCGKAYTTRQFLKNHQMRHTGERPFKCERCPKGFTTAVQLTWHTRSHTGEKPFQCDQCQQAFSMESNLKRHRNTVHLGFRKNVPCARCDKTFATNSTLKLHVRTVHDGEPWPKRELRQRKKKASGQVAKQQ